MKRILSTLAAVAIAGLASAAAVVWGGLYDVSATDQHLAPTYWLLDVAMTRSVARRSHGLSVPPLGEPGQVERGLVLYRDHCAQCHGAPGVPPEPFALGLTPAAKNLAHAGRTWTAQDLYWVISNGLKMTAMPAWRYQFSDADMWALVAFTRAMPGWTPRDYRERAARAPRDTRTTDENRGGAPPAGKPDPERGRFVMTSYACGTCHRIPGVVGPNAPVGPPLDGMARRAWIAGLLPNEPEHMQRWLRSPQSINPDSAMPDLNVSARDARDMAAYLATLD